MDEGQKDILKEDILSSLIEYKGIVTAACNAIGFNRSTFYRWMEEDLEFKKKVEDIQDVALDFVESKLFEKIKGVTVAGKDDVYDVPPSDTAIIFYLKTKGKKRGYIEKQELGFTDNEGNDVSPIQVFQLPDNNRQNNVDGDQG